MIQTSLKKGASLLGLSIVCFFFPLCSLAVKGKDGGELVLIPGGKFIMGSDKVDKKGRSQEFGSIKPFYLDEHPERNLTIDAFYIDKFEVSNAQYRDYVRDSGTRPPIHWVENGYLVSMKREKLDTLSVEKLRHLAVNVFHLDIDTRKMPKNALLKEFDNYFSMLDKVPVYNVNWYAAKQYCEAMGQHLPTEAQWEKVARGERGQEFPWGKSFLAGMSNTGDEEWFAGAAPIGSYETDISPYGVFDIAGNVSEWTLDWYSAYPGSDYHSDNFGKKYKVIRGAGWGGSGHYALQMYQRGAYRLYLDPASEHEDLGFRCVQEVEKAKSGKVAQN